MAPALLSWEVIVTVDLVTAEELEITVGAGSKSL